MRRIGESEARGRQALSGSVMCLIEHEHLKAPALLFLLTSITNAMIQTAPPPRASPSCLIRQTSAHRRFAAESHLIIVARHATNCKRQTRHRRHECEWGMARPTHTHTHTPHTHAHPHTHDRP